MSFFWVTVSQLCMTVLGDSFTTVSGSLGWRFRTSYDRFHCLTLLGDSFTTVHDSVGWQFHNCIWPCGMEIQHCIRQFPPKMSHPRNSRNRAIQIFRYKFELKQNFNFNLYCEILKNLSLLMWWIPVMLHFWWKLSCDGFRCRLEIHECIWLFPAANATARFQKIRTEYFSLSVNLHMFWVSSRDSRMQMTVSRCKCYNTFPKRYGVATISRLLKMIDLFCQRAL